MKGIVPSLNTPFDAAGALDRASLHRLVHHTVDAGCGGMLGLAVAGEHAMLSFAEKTAFLETVTDANAGRIPFVVSVTASTSEDSLELAKAAADYRASGICVQLPDAFSLRENLEFLQDLARQCPGIVMVQDLDWVGDGMAIEDIKFLFKQVDAFSWLKIETQNAGPKYSAVLAATDGALNVCGGWAVVQLMDAMARGVTAFIPTGMERVYVAIHRAFENGDVSTAARLFNQVEPVLRYSNQHVDTSIRFFKELRKAEGLFATNLCRVVTGEVDAAGRAESEQALEAALTLMNSFEALGEK